MSVNSALNTTPDNSVMKEIKLDLNGQHYNDETDDSLDVNISNNKKDDQYINLQKFKSFKSQQSKRETGRDNSDNESPLRFKNNRSNSSLHPINDEDLKDNNLQNVLNDNSIVNLGSKYQRIVEQDEESNYKSRQSIVTFNPEYRKTGNRRSQDNSFELKRQYSEDIIQLNSTG